MASVTRDKPKRDVRTPNRTASYENQSTKALALPTQENRPPTELKDSIVTIYGRKGIGKTSLAAQFPKSLVFMFERGRRNLPILMVPTKDEGPLNWQRMLDYINLATESDEIDTLVFDTIDRCYDACLEHVCRLAGCTHPQDKNDWGKTWTAIKTEFSNVMGAIQDTGKGVIFISHEKPKPLAKTSKGLRREDSEATMQYERMEPTCSNQAFEVIQEICDFVLYYGYTDEFRTITVRSPNDIVWTSCGIGDTFLDPDGNPVRTFKVGTNPKDAYDSLIKAYNNELYDIEYVPPRKSK